MTARGEDYTAALEAAAAHARSWLASVPDRPVPPRRTADELNKAFGELIPDGPTDPAAVVDQLSEVAEDGLMAIASGRFFGWVMGGTLPAALAADWLVSAWDQNAGHALRHPGRGRGRGDRRPLAARPARAARRLRCRLRDRGNHGQLHRLWPPAASRCSPTPAGTSTRTA